MCIIIIIRFIFTIYRSEFWAFSSYIGHPPNTRIHTQRTHTQVTILREVEGEAARAWPRLQHLTSLVQIQYGCHRSGIILDKWAWALVSSSPRTRPEWAFWRRPRWPLRVPIPWKLDRHGPQPPWPSPLAPAWISISISSGETWYPS